MAAEIAADAAAGLLGDPGSVRSLGDVDDRVDGNVYPAGGRGGDGFWDEARTAAHEARLLASGLIGRGLPGPAADERGEAFAGFQNAATHAVDRWLKSGGLARAAPGAPRP
jgi:hypothetical protein